LSKTSEKCGKQNIANSDPQSGRIFRIRGKYADQSSVDAIVGVLTNNIIIYTVRHKKHTNFFYHNFYNT